MTDLHSLAAKARTTSNRLLNVIDSQRAAAAHADLNALVTLAPLSPDGPDGPLYGVPVTVKDAFETKDLRTTASHPPLADHIPNTDADLVQMLRKTGAVIMGKTNLSQLCGDIQTDSPIFGLTANPWDKTRTSGGSSGGGAVAVATGISHLDLGSDLAGSLRIPAHFCGVAALKCTTDKWPMRGHIPPLEGQAPPPFQAAGLISRTVENLAQGYAAMEQTTVEPATTGTLQIGVITGLPLPLCPRTTKAMAQLETWIAPSTHLEHVKDLDFKTAWQAYGTDLMAGAAPFIVWWQRFGLKLIAATSGRRPLRQAMLRGMAGAPTAPQRAKAQELKNQIDTYLEKYDLLICPVTPTAAFPHTPKPRSRFTSRTIASGTQNLPYLEGSIGFTVLFSLTGHPAVILPVGVFDGLPVGVQLVGRHNDEANLLALATQLERTLADLRPAPTLPNNSTSQDRK